VPGLEWSHWAHFVALFGILVGLLLMWQAELTRPAWRQPSGRSSGGEMRGWTGSRSKATGHSSRGAWSSSGASSRTMTCPWSKAVVTSWSAGCKNGMAMRRRGPSRRCANGRVGA